MPLDITVKLGPEVKVYLSSSAQSLLSIDTADVATENVGGTIVWEDIGFYRLPIEWTEPTETVDIMKGFDIDHTKRGRQQRKTGSMIAAYQNASLSIRKYNDKHCLLKIEWHVDGAGAVDEFEYLKGVRFTSFSHRINEGEVQDSADFNFADWGRRPVS